VPDPAVYDPHVATEPIRISFAPRTSELFRSRVSVELGSPRIIALHTLLPAVVGLSVGLIKFHSLLRALAVVWAFELLYWTFAAITTLVLYHANPAFREWRTLTIEEPGIALAMGNRHSIVPWSTFQTYHSAKRGRALLIKESHRLLLIPDRAFTTPTKRAQADALIRSHVPAASWRTRHASEVRTFEPVRHGWSIESGGFGATGRTDSALLATEGDLSTLMDERCLALVGLTTPESQLGLMRSSSVKNPRAALTADFMAVAGGMFFVAMGGLIAVAGLHPATSTDTAGNPRLGSIVIAFGLLGVATGLLLCILTLSFLVLDRMGRRDRGTRP
jgi:hypothetical protein